MGADSTENRSDPTFLHESHNDLVFETRLRDDRTITLLFAPRGINFQDFLDRFCEVWRMDAESIN